MRFILAVTVVMLLWGCGIMSLIFGFPQRYIERNVKTNELAGTWNVTPESESTVNKFVKDFPEWGAGSAWKTFTLNADGTCEIKLELAWLPNINAIPTESLHLRIPKDLMANNMMSCSWQLTKIKNVENKDVSGIELTFDHPNDYYAEHSLYIFEENSKLILWDLIGDPDDFSLQEFMKTQK